MPAAFFRSASMSSNPIEGAVSIIPVRPSVEFLLLVVRLEQHELTFVSSQEPIVPCRSDITTTFRSPVHNHFPGW
jgi:hypothetical protein